MEVGPRRWRRVASMAWGRVDGAEVSREVASMAWGRGDGVVGARRYDAAQVLEKNVLVTAVRAHVEDRIIVYESKCVVFGE